MHILVINDDGIHAPGLEALANALSVIADVTIVAPATEKSAASHSLTLNNILKVDEIHKNGKFFGYAVHGTPVDCAKLGLQQLVKQKPDYIFSGINNGANLSSQVHYSGTVSAAVEGPINGITAVAVSLSTFKKAENMDFSVPAEMAVRWLKKLESMPLPKKILYNINVPGKPLEKLKGFAASKLTNSEFEMHYEKRQSPRGETYFWLSTVSIPDTFEQGSDVNVMREGYVSVTPMILADRTGHDEIEQMKKLGAVDNV